LRALVDTHVLLWWLSESHRLSRRCREAFENPANELLWSAASSWELAIKVGLGRLELPAPPRVLIPRVMQEQSLLSLDVTHAHVLAVAELPAHHHDPFDRLLIAQAQAESLPVLSADRIFEDYGRERLW